MKEDAPSFTAVFAAWLRAAHQVLDDDPKILADPLAVGLVEGSSEDELLANSEDLHSPGMKGLRSALVLRSRYAEDALAESATSIGQYVILGAGLDSFAYRQPPWARHLRIFEVDHPATQRWKRERLAEVGIELPPNLVFCPIDFEHSSLAEGLGDVSFNRETPTFFSWLGVTQYLTNRSIDQTLGHVASLPPPTQIVFTFLLPDGAIGASDAADVATASSIAAARGEPWITRIEPQSLSERLRGLGFSAALHLTPALAKDRYYSGRTDELPVPVIEQLMLARV
jgi:methyltransferase (TIGR00027 family)